MENQLPQTYPAINLLLEAMLLTIKCIVTCNKDNFPPTVRYHAWFTKNARFHLISGKAGFHGNSLTGSQSIKFGFHCYSDTTDILGINPLCVYACMWVRILSSVQ